MPDIFREYVGVVVSTIIGVALGYVGRIFFARMAGASPYGMFYAVVYLSSTFASVLFAGISVALINKLASAKSEEEKSRKIAVALVLSAIPVVSSFIVFYVPWFSNIGALDVAVPLVTLGLVSVILVRAILQGDGKVVEGSFADVIRPLSVFISVFFLRFGLFFMLAVYGISNLILSLFLLLVKKRTIKAAMPTKKDFHDIIVYAAPVFITAASLSLFNQLDAVLLTAFRSVKEVGLYEIASPIANIIKYVVSPFAVVLFPLVSSMFSRNQDIRGVSSMFFKFSLLVSIPAFLVIFSFPNIILNLVFGPQYLSVEGAVRILAVSALFWSLFSVSSAIISAMNRPSVPTKISLVFGTLNAIADLFVVPAFGYYGAAVTTMLAGVFSFGASYAYLLKKGIYSMDVPEVAMLFAPGVVVLAFVYAAKEIVSFNPYAESVIIGILGAVVYVALLKVFGIVKQHEAEMLSAHIPSIRPLLRWLSD